MSIERIADGTPSLAVRGQQSKDSPEKIQEAAKQFEALLIGQMLKSMRDSEGGWLGTGDDKSSASAMDYAQEMFAQCLSSNGGLGLASLLARGLERPSEP